MGTRSLVNQNISTLFVVALCSQPEAQVSFEAGFAAQQKGETDAAITQYTACLEKDPSCLNCRYELGWSYWKKGDFKAVVREWKSVLSEELAAPEIVEQIKESLPTAESRSGMGVKPLTHQSIGHVSTPADSPVHLKLIARFQSYDPKAEGYDLEVSSPKSAAAHPSQTSKAKKVYIQSLEAKKTLVFDSKKRTKIGVIDHEFKPEHAKLFSPLEPPEVRFPSSVAEEKRNVFAGKPVEATFSHGGRYLYVPYYRREYDLQGTMPSAMAVIDTRNDTIKRVMPTGPISKYVAVSPNGKILAISNWGDNTLHLVDISSKTHRGFKFLGRLVVEKPLPLEGIEGDRDHACGFCLRGIAFSANSRYMFVTRMSGGGLAIFDLLHPKKAKYLGSVFGIWPSPRDLLVTKGGHWLYVSCNSTGHIAKIRVRDLIKLVRAEANEENRQRVRLDREKVEVKDASVGLGARTMRLSKDEKYLFVAVNLASKLAVVDTKTMEMISSIEADPYPVGLDVTPDGKQLWLTSQGRDGMGGNAVGVYEIQRKKK